MLRMRRGCRRTSEDIQQRPESGWLLDASGDRREFEPPHGLAAPERTYRDEQLEIAANRDRKNRFGHDLLQLLMGELAHMCCLASVGERMVRNDDLLEQRLHAEEGGGGSKSASHALRSTVGFQNH